jgi:AraC-like DNA-binding protein
MSDSGSKKYYFRYLPVAPADMDWGLHVTAVGRSLVAANEHYPPAPHPQGYDYEWPDARVLQEFQCLYVTRGQGAFETEATGYQDISAGNLFFLFPDQWHRYRPDPETGWDEYWVSFDGELPRRLLERGVLSPSRAVYDVGLNQSILHCYKDLLDAADADQGGYPQIAAMLTAQLIARAQAAVYEEDDTAQKILRSAIFRIEQDVDQSINFEQLARDLGTGYSSFRHEFKRYVGLSPKQYHLQLRISKAKNLLTNTALAVKQVASLLNFESPYYFMKLFKRKTGMSPTQWRQYSRGGNDSHKDQAQRGKH